MRPGNRWNGASANPVVAALCGAAVALIMGYALSYLLERADLGVISGPGTWRSPRQLLLSALNLYAAHHIALVGSGTIPEVGQLHATIRFPLTVWAAIPAISLMMGGLVAARMRAAAGRWGMAASAFLASLIYVAVLAVLCRFVSAMFTSAVLPSLQGFEFNPPDMPFRPSVVSAVGYGSLFAVLFTYFGALLGMRRVVRSATPGQWWACAKAVLVVGLYVQAIVAAGLWVWFAMNAHVREGEANTQAKFVQLLPTAAGVGYSLVYGANLTYGAVPIDMPSASYGSDMSLYKGITTRNGREVAHKDLSRWVFIVAIIGAIAAFLSGRLAVKWGSRDGSLPTAIRIAVVQAAYLAALMLLCGMGWGIAGQFRVFVSPLYNSAMLWAGAGVLVSSLIGAHFANRRYAGPLGGFPAV